MSGAVGGGVMKIRIHTATVERESTNDDFPEVELPDDAVVLDVSAWAYTLQVTYYVPTLRSDTAP